MRKRQVARRYEAWSVERAAAILLDQGSGEGRLLPVLHAVQEAFGHVPADAVPILAEHFNLSRAEIHGTISFYHDFRREPPGRHVLKLCRAEACQAMGADRLHEDVKQQLGIGWHGTTADGRVTLEPVFCLGLCATAPAALLDDKPLVRLEAAALAGQLADLPA